MPSDVYLFGVLSQKILCARSKENLLMSFSSLFQGSESGFLDFLMHGQEIKGCEKQCHAQDGHNPCPEFQR